MRKSFLYGLVLATALFSGCKGDYDDWAAPQINEQEEAQGISVNISAAPAIEMANVTSETVQLFSAASVSAPEGFSVTSYEAIISKSDDSSVKTVMPADASGSFLTSDVVGIVESFYGKNPVARSLSVTVNAYVQKDDQAFCVTSNSVDATVTLTAPVIESAYYFVGTNNGWNVQDDTYKFAHNDEVNVYDDPIFTLTIEAPVKEDGTRDDMWFKIAPQSAFETGDWATVLGLPGEKDGDTSLSGALVSGGNGALKMPADDGAKFYIIELNMMDYAYTITPLSFEEYIYVPGDHVTDWAPAAAPALRSPNFDGIYTGYCYLESQFKFTKQRNWDAEYNANDFTTKSEGLGGDNNITIDTPGFYQIVADITAKSLTVTETTTWGIIGPGQAGGWDSDTDMTYNKEEGCWEATLDLVADNIKFRANDDWAINVGGTFDDLSENGADIAVPEAGTYVVKLYLSRSTSDKMYCTLTKQ